MHILIFPTLYLTDGVFEVEQRIKYRAVKEQGMI